jgi:hypothetical protein
MRVQKNMESLRSVQKMKEALHYGMISCYNFNWFFYKKIASKLEPTFLLLLTHVEERHAMWHKYWLQ